MSSHNLEADYLIVGSGAVGMAFADTLLSETDASLIIVDRYAKPGGHWNMAYPFVTLHQPSAFYGVSSKELAKGSKDEVGLNKGLHDLATGDEVSAYFEEVMRHRFLPSGRVQYFPMCEYQSDGNFVSKLSGKQYHASAHKKTVDCTFLNTSVPATHTPSFEIEEGVRFMPLNDLVNVTEPPAGYVIIGGGKTGIDACLWLLENGVDPDTIEWIMPRDAWLLDRANTQPSDEFFAQTMGAQAAQVESIAQADSVDDMFDRLESSGYFVRIDTSVRPQMFHGATISQLELQALRQIKNVIRLGRVTHLGSKEIVFEQGRRPTSPQHLHIDCSASAITNLESKPVFAGELITPQTVRSYQPVFSAAFIAHVEATYDNEVEKNALCNVVPLPNTTDDYLRLTAAFMMNQYQWSQNKEIRAWLLDNRLDGFSKIVANIQQHETDKLAIMKRLRDNSMPAMAKLQEFLAAL
ncbi:MAG: NAD(P)/FAD-dependent oxidoreductase [Gammaproteobacteria bacterium]|nr:NAD(P)/FAD-dependent oxidoreductase [Gammaproteobacteria bacterium]